MDMGVTKLDPMNRGLKRGHQHIGGVPMVKVTKLDPMNRGLKREEPRPLAVIDSVTKLDPMNRGLKPAYHLAELSGVVSYKARPDE